MAFVTILDRYRDFDFQAFFNQLTNKTIEAILYKEKMNEMEFLSLLSDKAAPFIEQMAKKARQITLRNFGRVIQLYIPLYLANYCTNECVYCGFNRKNPIDRRVLSLDEIEKNAAEISKSGIRHILFLTGEAPELTPLDYLLDAAGILKKYFSSLSTEIYPMEIEDYRELKKAGVDGLTVYQEVYDRKIYDRVHLAGEKKDYLYRLDTPERGAMAGFRSVNIGPLFGLGDPVTEAFFAGLHAKYLQDSYLDTEVSLSLPRLNEAEGGFQALYNLDDSRFVQFMLAYRLFLPRAGITISTRERPDFRDHIIPLGVTRMSAGSVTSVGGYVTRGNTPQFEIADERSVPQIVESISRMGYEAVYKDWEQMEEK